MILLAPHLAVDGGAAVVRLNPLRAILAARRRLGLTPGELVRYVPEPRRMVLARIVTSDGTPVVVGCTHCHNARDPGVVGLEIARAAAALARAAAGAYTQLTPPAI